MAVKLKKKKYSSVQAAFFSMKCVRERNKTLRHM